MDHAGCELPPRRLQQARQVGTGSEVWHGVVGCWHVRYMAVCNHATAGSDYPCCLAGRLRYGKEGGVAILRRVAVG